MAGVSGLDIVSVIKGKMPWAVIVIISGYSEYMLEAAEEYTDLVLSKPVRVPMLQSVVQISRELTRKRESLKELSGEQ